MVSMVIDDGDAFDGDDPLDDPRSTLWPKLNLHRGFTFSLLTVVPTASAVASGPEMWRR